MALVGDHPNPDPKGRDTLGRRSRYEEEGDRQKQATHPRPLFLLLLLTQLERKREKKDGNQFSLSLSLTLLPLLSLFPRNATKGNTQRQGGGFLSPITKQGTQRERESLSPYYTLSAFSPLLFLPPLSYALLFLPFQDF